MPDFRVHPADTTDATFVIPARLGREARPSALVDVAYTMTVPLFQLPTWQWIDEEVVGETTPHQEFIESPLPVMTPEEANALMTLDSVHNPLLAELWQDDVNDNLVDNP